MSDELPTSRTDSGFTVGELEVSLAYSSESHGATVVLRTPTHEMQVHVSSKGRSLRAFGPERRGR